MRWNADRVYNVAPSGSAGFCSATLAGVVGCAPAGCQSAAGVALYGEIPKKHTAVIDRAATRVQRGYPAFAVSELARWESDLKKYKEGSARTRS
jgi:hypothetical protein